MKSTYFVLCVKKYQGEQHAAECVVTDSLRDACGTLGAYAEQANAYSVHICTVDLFDGLKVQAQWCVSGISSFNWQLNVDTKPVFEKTMREAVAKSLPYTASQLS